MKDNGIYVLNTYGHDKDEDGDKYEHGTGKDPHLWLNPLLVKKQVETIRDALIKADPAGKSDYEKNCIKL